MHRTGCGVRLAVVRAFALTVLPLSVTPGVSFALVTSRVLSGGRGQGPRVAAGTACGLHVHATLAAIGLAALVMASSCAFTVLKIAGAAYLIILGLAMLLRRHEHGAAALPWTGHGPFTQALLGNVLNPKAASVHLTLLPQFVDPDRGVARQIYLLATVHAVIAVAFLSVLSHLVSAAATTLRTPFWGTTTQRITGTALVLLGVRSATSSPAP